MDKDKWCIIVYKLKPKINVLEKNKIIRKLYGYKEHSNYNRYQYVREGLLSNIEYFPLSRSVIITKSQYKNKILSFLKGKANVYTFEIKINKKEINRLNRLRKKGVVIKK